MWRAPTETDRKLVELATAVGVLLCSRVPSPIAPVVLDPQQYRRPLPGECARTQVSGRDKSKGLVGSNRHRDRTRSVAGPVAQLALYIGAPAESAPLRVQPTGVLEASRDPTGPRQNRRGLGRSPIPSPAETSMRDL